jgi:hypothetical protein
MLHHDATHMQLSDEHCAYQWVTMEQAQALFPAGHWLRALIARAEMVRGLMPHELRQFYRHEGFELLDDESDPRGCQSET